MSQNKGRGPDIMAEYPDRYPIIISYYTPTWEYKKYAQAIIRDLAHMDLDSYIRELPDTGSWISNTRLKPKFILDTLLEFNRPVLWVDADGIVLKRPEFLKGDKRFDFAAKTKPTDRSRRWHVGTMYFNNTVESIDFLVAWCSMIETAQDDESDEMVLHKLWISNCDEVVKLLAIDLPKEYFQMLNGENPDPLRNTIIAHRASKGDSKKEYLQNKPPTEVGG